MILNHPKPLVKALFYAVASLDQCARLSGEALPKDWFTTEPDQRSSCFRWMVLH
jgi:hypothetical protein